MEKALAIFLGVVLHLGLIPSGLTLSVQENEKTAKFGKGNVIVGVFYTLVLVPFVPRVAGLFSQRLSHKKEAQHLFVVQGLLKGSFRILPALIYLT